jgi:hypothetical protein
MAPIHIEVKLEFPEFLRLMFFLTYRRPLIILMTALGVVGLIWGILAMAGLIGVSAFTPEITVAYGLFLLLWIPVAAYFRSRRYYRSSKRMQELRRFDFTQESIQVESASANHEYRWDSIYEVRETGKWLLVFMSRAEAIFIPKSAFSDQKWTAFQALLATIPGLKVKLK